MARALPGTDAWTGAGRRTPLTKPARGRSRAIAGPLPCGLQPGASHRGPPLTRAVAGASFVTISHPYPCGSDQSLTNEHHCPAGCYRIGARWRASAGVRSHLGGVGTGIRNAGRALPPLSRSGKRNPADPALPSAAATPPERQQLAGNGCGSPGSGRAARRRFSHLASPGWDR